MSSALTIVSLLLYVIPSTEYTQHICEGIRMEYIRNPEHQQHRANRGAFFLAPQLPSWVITKLSWADGAT